MKTSQKIAFIILVLLLSAAVYGLFRTGGSVTRPAVSDSAPAGEPAGAPVVDQTALLTAQRLAQLPTNAAEKHFAEEALRLGDHEMDLAFAAAVLDAEVPPPDLSADANDTGKIEKNKKINETKARLEKAKKALEEDGAQIKQLSAAREKASGDKKDSLDDQLEVTKAHQELHQDEADDAEQDLIRVGGDPKGRIQKMVEEHEATSHAADSFHVVVSSAAQELGLVRLFQQWAALHQKQSSLWQAKQEAESAAKRFTAKHAELDEKIDKQKSSTAPAEGGHAANRGQFARRTRKESKALVASTKLLAAGQQAMALFDKRIDDQNQLADNYCKWIEVVAAKQRAIVHSGLTGLASVFAFLLLGMLLNGLLKPLLGKTHLDRRQIETLRGVTRVGIQVAAVLFILLVIFGPPSQLGTFLGLAGAGLTVALKDFIVAFIGWLALMGKNGVRLGDWVEINGVTGEVVELGMFHTVLLETGNWTDSGHPTGRRVTFTNSFAIEGHFFNFSTSGQWLWDELRVVLPSGLDPYPVIDAIQKKVAEATAETAKQAEQEWQLAARTRNMSSPTAAPAINVKPVVGGIEIAVRYITRANERYLLRAKLYQAAVDLLGGKNVQLPPAPAPAPGPSSD